MSQQILLIIHIAISTFLISIILLQQGKGADVGATFGGGGNTLFGAAGADSLLTRVTAFAAFGFMLTSLLLALSQKPSLANQSNLFNSLPEEAVVVPAPATETGSSAETGTSAEELNTEKENTEKVGGTTTQAPAPVAAPTEKLENNKNLSANTIEEPNSIDAETKILKVTESALTDPGKVAESNDSKAVEAAAIEAEKTLKKSVPEKKLPNKP